jgi:putative ABC transport system permease protein
MQSPTLLLRTTIDPSALAEAIRRETKALLPNLPPPMIQTMDALLSDTVAQPRLQAGLLGLFGAVALMLTAVGIFGVVALWVAQRTRELGVRIALGAQRRNVLTLVLGQGIRLALIGMGVGLLASFALSRVMRSLLYGVAPTDPLTLAGAGIVLLAVALIACWIPARRATRIDPMEALRTE